MPDPPLGHRMRIFGQMPGCRASLCVSLILKWTKNMQNLLRTKGLSREMVSVRKRLHKQPLSSQKYYIPRGNYKLFVQMLYKLAKKPYAAAERIFSQFGIWILKLSFNRENEKHEDEE